MSQGNGGKRGMKAKRTFLGTNQDAFAEAGAMGMRAGGVANYSIGRR
jgi:hypothetical protein